MLADELEEGRAVDVEELDDGLQALLDTGIDLLRRQANEMTGQLAQPVLESLEGGFDRSALPGCRVSRLAERPYRSRDHKSPNIVTRGDRM